MGGRRVTSHDRPSTDSEKVAVLVKTSAKDFTWESGYFYIQTNFLTHMLYWDSLDKFGNAIAQRARDLGKRLKFTVEEEPCHPTLGETILVSWRAMTIEERLREDLEEEFHAPDADYVSPKERLDRVMPKLMKELNDG